MAGPDLTNTGALSKKGNLMSAAIRAKRIG